MNKERLRKEKSLMKLEAIPNPYRDELAKRLEKNNQAYTKTARVLKTAGGKSIIAQEVMNSITKAKRLKEAIEKEKETRINFNLSEDEINSVLGKTK